MLLICIRLETSSNPDRRTIFLSLPTSLMASSKYCITDKKSVCKDRLLSLFLVIPCRMMRYSRLRIALYTILFFTLNNSKFLTTTSHVLDFVTRYSVTWLISSWFYLNLASVLQVLVYRTVAAQI